jgi:hypothetical protein
MMSENAMCCSDYEFVLYLQSVCVTVGAEEQNIFSFPTLFSDQLAKGTRYNDRRVEVH